MKSGEKRLVPYHMIQPGFEAIYTGERAERPIEVPKGPSPFINFTDSSGNAIQKWSTWTWTFTDKWPEEGREWANEEIRYINGMQVKLGHLSDGVRKIRAHIGSLVPCDNGFPVTVDELLSAIGKERLDDPSFHNGCWMGTMWWDGASTQPLNTECMQAIFEILTGYLAGKPEAEMAERYPHARGFIARAYVWLGPSDKLTKLQKLMMERTLLPFEYFTGRNTDNAVNRNCFEEGGHGPEVDAEISALAGLPKIHMRHTPEYRENLNGIPEPEKRELYRACCHIASGVYGLSDCHHNTFRIIERWVHGIGKGALDIPESKKGTERERLGRLLFGYLLGLDRWLLGVPMYFLLYDLEYVDFGFDPNNEIKHVYALLEGERGRNPTKEWLAACLWHNLFHNNQGGITRHGDVLDRAKGTGLSVREWMDSNLNKVHR